MSKIIGKQEISLVFVGKEKIQEINKKYRRKDQPTDVLSFDEDLNEIFICPDVVRSQAKMFDVSFKAELARVLIPRPPVCKRTPIKLPGADFVLKPYVQWMDIGRHVNIATCSFTLILF